MGLWLRAIGALNLSSCVESAQKEPPLSCTAYGAILRSQLKSPEQIKKSRQPVATIGLIALSLTWIGVLLYTNRINETLAWACTFFFTALGSIAWTCASRSISPLLLFRIGENRWATLAGSLASTMAVFSVIFGSWLSFHHVFPNAPIVANRQIIDIELVSANDYVDKHDVLPSTKPPAIPPRDLARQGKPAPAADSHKGAVSAPTASLIVATAATTIGAHRKAVLPPAKNLTNVYSDQSFVIRQQPQALPPPKRSIPKVRPAPPIDISPPMLQEVAPPELLEVTDSQGERAGEVSQTGGHSTGGLGSQTLLVSYLKELHRRIKRAWTPTDGETRSAQILFRIRKNGQLASIKLVRTSGETGSDDAAMHAIVASSPFKALPPEFSSEYLDLLYTFNYKVDQLSEVTGSQTH